MFRAAILLATGLLPSVAIAQLPEPSPSPAAGPRRAPHSYASTVRGDKADTLRKSSGTNTVITQEDIKRAQPQNAGELLSRVPGLQVRQEDQSGFRLNLGVRGLSPTRSRLILVEEDGVPVVVSPYGEPELYYMTSVERIASMDVLKGSDVLRYGPQSVGAVVQIHTFDPTPTPSWYTAVTAGERAYVDTLARYSSTTASGIGYLTQFSYKQGNGFRAMGFDAADGMGKLRIPTGTVGVLNIKLAIHYDLANTTYTGLTDKLYEQDPRQNTIAPNDNFGVQRYELSFAHDLTITPTTHLHTALFGYQMNLSQRSQDFDRNQLPGVTYESDPRDLQLQNAGLWFRTTTSLRDRVYDVGGLSAELEQRFNIGPVKNKLLLGVRGMVDSARRQLSDGTFPTADSGNLLTDDTTTIFGLGAWIEDQIALSDWVLITPAFRMEYSHTTKVAHRIENDESAPEDVHIVTTSSSNGPAPGIGTVVGKPNFNVFTSFHYGYSAPRVSQAITPEGLDSNLHAEHSTNYELGMRGRVGNWLRAEGDFFFLNFGNELVSNNPLSGADSEFIDGGKTQHLGAEATATVRFGRAFNLPLEIDLAGQYTFVRSRFVGGQFNGKTVPYSPPHTAVATLDVTHLWTGHGGHMLGAQVAFSYIGSQYADEQNTVEPDPTGLTGRINAYTTLDLGARYRNSKTGLSFALAVKNALDQVYISDRLPNGIFTSGFRQINATLAWSTPGH